MFAGDLMNHKGGRAQTAYKRTRDGRVTGYVAALTFTDDDPPTAPAPVAEFCPTPVGRSASGLSVCLTAVGQIGGESWERPAITA